MLEDQPRCETRTGNVRCYAIATHRVTAAGSPATEFMPERPAITTYQCAADAAMWTRRDRKGRPVHPNMTAEPLP